MSRMSLFLTIIAALILAVVGCDKPVEVEEPEAAQAEAPEEITAELAGEPTQEEESMSIYNFSVDPIAGEATDLSEYKGQVMLIVNVASECGFTPQYEGLQELWERYQDRGLAVLGFPTNDFGGQEPGTNEEIAEFCTGTFGVDFPMYSKITVKGEETHPLYAHLVDETGEEVSWNFNKFLVNREGKVLRRFESKVEPLSEELVGAIEELL